MNMATGDGKQVLGKAAEMRGQDYLVMPCSLISWSGFDSHALVSLPVQP